MQPVEETPAQPSEAEPIAVEPVAEEPAQPAETEQPVAEQPAQSVTAEQAYEADMAYIEHIMEEANQEYAAEHKDDIAQQPAQPEEGDGDDGGEQN